MKVGQKHTFKKMEELPSKPGFVYAMTSGSLQDSGLIKIGRCTCPPLERAKQLTSSTAAPSPFVVLYSKKVSDCVAAEALLHERFADRRINDKREFFQVSLEEVAFSMDRVARLYSYLSPDGPAMMPLPWAELFNSFDQNEGSELTAEEQRKCRQLAAKLRTT